MNESLLSFLLPLSSFLISIYAQLISWLRFLGFIRRIPSSAIILPPAAPGSLGDEAMVVATVDYLKRNNIKNISVLFYNVKQEYPVESLEVFDMRDFFIYSKWYKFIFKLMEFGYQASRYENFFLLGADLMDGYYSNSATFKRVKLVELSSRLGLRSAILGFSYNQNPTYVSIQLLNNLFSQVTLCARDKVSYERLTKSLSRPVNLVADLAFLLTPCANSEKVTTAFNWIEEQRKQGNQIVGVNINFLLIKKVAGKTLDDLVQAFVDNLVALRHQNSQLSFVFLPHDFRDIQGALNDDKLSKQILNKLPIELQSCFFKIPFPCLAAEVKAIVKDLDVVVSSRMHLAIACLGQGVPVGCISYQGKFEGLYQHFDLKPLTIAPEDLLQPNSLKMASLVIEILHNKSQLQEQIQNKITDVKQLSAANFDLLKPLP